MSTLRKSAEGILRDAAGCISRALGVIKTPWLRRHWSRLPALLGGRRPAPVMIAVRHVGATERFGAELRALRDIEVSPELVTDIETELRWGLIWHDFERMMQDEIDQVFDKYLPALECVDFDDLRELIGLSEPAGELSLVAA